MKKAISLLLVAVCVIFGFVSHCVKPYYMPAMKQGGLNICTHTDDTIRVGYIGDSWADGHKKVDCVIASLVGKEIGKNVEVKTAGISGLTSKNIYYSIFRDDSVRRVIEWGPNFCFVVAGINDTDRKMGNEYYRENMRLIIETLLDNRIIPLILEIPHYDIKFSFKRRSKSTKLLYLISMLVTWSKMDCIEDYRQALTNLIQEQQWENQVKLISHKDWNPDGYLDRRGLYDEGFMHLTKRGYLVLDTCISNKIIATINASSNNGGRR